MTIDHISSIKQKYNIDIIDLWNEQTYFCWEELVPKDVFNARGENCIELFNENALRTLIELRELFGYSININNWKWGGSFQYRGFRPASFYNRISYSQHLLGNAFDFDVKGFSAQEARIEIIRWKNDGFLKYLTGIELDVNWVHIDIRITARLDSNGLYLFKP